MKRIGTVVLSTLAIAAVVFVAGCGGGSSTTPATATPSPTTIPTATPTSTLPPQPYAFSGSTGTIGVAASASPSPVYLAPYQNITVASIQFAAASAKGSLVFSDALDNGDIAPALVADNATPGNTPVLYLSTYNPGSDINFGNVFPSISITSSAGFGVLTACNFDVFSLASSTWAAVMSGGTIAGSTISFASSTLPSGTVDFPQGQTISAISCH